ncbi:MAG: NAD-dependent deacylase [Microscillaceae bacterium]|nr:NAD-dependent deacylase [Microscillaceae bacterium]MDW8460768.1 NAD-dependent deacylase [Cytophagales bacterium]
MQKKHVVVLTGAGISAESGLKTFRDSGGLWENYDVMEVASIEGWQKNPELVLKFYNERRKQAYHAQPNAGHLALKELEKYYKVSIITQNVDNLHEKAGSTNVIHLHGELSKVRSEKYEDLIYEWGDKEIHLGDKCERGAQLRPHIVWFGEVVPMMEHAINVTLSADYFLVIGTSLNVYPAAGLINYLPATADIYVIDPHAHELPIRSNKKVKLISEKATIGVPKVVALLIEEATKQEH